MVDNFDIIAPLLKFENPGDCYYVQLLRRQSDDPMIGGRPDPSYHGNMHSRSLKDYLVTSVERFLELKTEMAALCKAFNVRAYIRLNKRNYRNIDLAMLKHIAEQCASGESFSSPFHIVASAAGSVCQAGKDKTWIVDCDACHMDHLDAIEGIVRGCEPYVSGKYADETIPRIPTKHGVHLVPHPFNKQAFSGRWYEYVRDNRLTNPLPQNTIEPDWTHFSFTGNYLKHVPGFVDICERNGFRCTVDRIDRNKTIVHLEDRSYDYTFLKEEWGKYCTTEGFYLDPPDLHTDNPTVLLVP